MRTPTASELLDVWEISIDSRPAERALALLALALPELGADGAARCSIGTRDDLLLSLRERLFGARLTSVAHCPACDEAVETSLTAAALRASLAPPGAIKQAPFELAADGYRIAYRLPTTEDMLAIADESDPDAVRRLLLARCILALQRGESDVTLAELPPATVDALEAAMAAADPMADIECALTCPACAHGWRVDLDIVRYLWTELHGWAQRLLVDVHTLARTYGWREADILAMSAGRRSLYVEMSAS